MALHFYCPGCDIHHYVSVEAGDYYIGPVWTWNGDMEKPTFEPSLGINMGMDRQCHLFVRDGMIQYLDDCTHELHGQTIPMEDAEE